MFVLSSVSAIAYTQVDYSKRGLAQKDAEWNVIPNGAKGEITLTYLTDNVYWNIYSQTARATVYGLEPRTSYTLIYYGYGNNNDVWNYATCITKGTTSTQGYVKMMSGKFNFWNFMHDNVSQKLWVVKSSDVDCTNHKMVAWNPSQYLFETQAI